jgi:hypothetical protein
MMTDTLFFNAGRWDFLEENITEKIDADLVMVFGDSETFKKEEHYAYLRSLYKDAVIFGASALANVLNADVHPYPIVATAVKFESASVKLSVIDFDEQSDLLQVGKDLVRGLPEKGLKNIFILSDGIDVNGSLLARGASDGCGSVLITGGLAGDDSRFEDSWVMADDVPKRRRAAAVGFYGEHLTVSSGSSSGWEEFGMEYLITRSDGNVVYEIDHQPALQLYKRYLGEYTETLSRGARRFPLSIKEDGTGQERVRSVSSIDEEAQSLTFIGDVPQGSRARLMRSNMEGLIASSHTAAEKIGKINKRNALGLVVSCACRTMVLKQHTDRELKAVEERLGSNVQLTGFYAYGEFGPSDDTSDACSLHNQSMMLTVIYEDLP